MLLGFVLTIPAMAKAKKKKKVDNVLVFDISGKLISFPKIVVRKNQTICFKVKAPVRFIKLILLY